MRTRGVGEVDARAIEKLSRWWLVANVDSAESRGGLIVVALCLGKRYQLQGLAPGSDRAVACEGKVRADNNYDTQLACEPPRTWLGYQSHVARRLHCLLFTARVEAITLREPKPLMGDAVDSRARLI
jgi:hypothetical protein